MRSSSPDRWDYLHWVKNITGTECIKYRPLPELCSQEHPIRILSFTNSFISYPLNWNISRMPFEKHGIWWHGEEKDREGTGTGWKGPSYSPVAADMGNARKTKTCHLWITCERKDTMSAEKKYDSWQGSGKMSLLKSFPLKGSEQFEKL